MPFKVGDVVQLISGGPSMTIIRTPPGRSKGYPQRDDDNYVRCAWFDSDDNSKIQGFPPAALKRVVK